MKLKKITVKDKDFVLAIASEEITRIVDTLAQQINHDLAGKEVIFMPVLNGSFIFAADLIRKITIPGILSFVKLASYQEDKRGNAVKTLIGLNEEISNKCILIIEDIVDSGSTLAHVVGDLTSRGVNEIRIVTMLLKPDIYKGAITIDYVGKQVPNNFVLGYGLDYDGYGRNFKDIYRMVQG